MVMSTNPRDGVMLFMAVSLQSAPALLIYYVTDTIFQHEEFMLLYDETVCSAHPLARLGRSSERNSSFASVFELRLNSLIHLYKYSVDL